MAPIGNPFPITAPLSQCNSDAPSTPWNPVRVEYISNSVDQSLKDRIRTLETKIKVMERERDMWRMRAFSKKR